MHDLDGILAELRNHAARMSFSELPEDKDAYYVVWVMREGERSLGRPAGAARRRHRVCR